MTLVTVVVPCFNSSLWLKDLVKEVEDIMNSSEYDFEIILVNDSSTDGETWNSIKKIAEENEEILGIDLLKNSGQFATTLCGMSYSKGDIVVTIDDDFQHNPADILTLVTRLESDEDIDGVIAKWKEKRHSVFRRLGSRFYNYVVRKSSGTRVNLQMNSFRALRRRLVDRIIENEMHSPVMGMLLLKSSDALVNLEIEHRLGTREKSEYGIIKLARITLSNIIDSTTAPLRIFSILGVMTFTISLISAISLFLLRVQGVVNSPGYASMLIVISAYGGISMMGIGLIGEYVARMVPDVRRESPFGVRRTSQKDE